MFNALSGLLYFFLGFICLNRGRLAVDLYLEFAVLCFIFYGIHFYKAYLDLEERLQNEKVL